MKKSVKIIITAVIGVIFFVSIGFGITSGIKNGIIKEPKNLSGKVIETWRGTNAYIMHGELDYTKYYSNNDDDYISHIFMVYGNNPDWHEISYSQHFDATDDLEVYFVIQAKDGTRFSTSVETSHTDYKKDYIYFYSTYSQADLHIAEVWVRTED